jgi:hypothetical protein
VGPVIGNAPSDLTGAAVSVDGGDGGGVLDSPRADGVSCVAGVQCASGVCTDGFCGSKVTFRQINGDMDRPTFGCTQPLHPCHGTAMPTGIVEFLQNGLSDPKVLAANYQAALTQIDLEDPAKSPLLLNPLVSPGVTHTGGKVQDPRMTTYNRWLNWIRAGAPF